MTDRLRLVQSGPTKAALLQVLNMGRVAAVPLHWLWKGWLARGKLHLMAGMPGVGKSYVTCDLAARITRGRAWPDGSPCAEPAEVLFLCGEDGLEDTVRQRLDAHEADCEKVHVVRSRTLISRDGRPCKSPVSLGRDLDLLDDLLRRNPAIRVLVVDPVPEYLPGTEDNTAVRAALAPLGRLAESRRVAVLMVSHFKKGRGGPAIYKTLGSVAFTTVARIAWAFIPDSDDPDRVLMLPLKNNLHKRMSGLAYRIVEREAGCRLEWETESVDLTADEAMAGDREGRKSRVDEAVEWLTQRLSRGAVESSRLVAEAQEFGIARRTLWRAKDVANIAARKSPTHWGGWTWYLPNTDPRKLADTDRRGRFGLTADATDTDRRGRFGLTADATDTDTDRRGRFGLTADATSETSTEARLTAIKASLRSAEPFENRFGGEGGPSAVRGPTDVPEPSGVPERPDKEDAESPGIGSPSPPFPSDRCTEDQ